jgi:hypothetical protein
MIHHSGHLIASRNFSEFAPILSTKDLPSPIASYLGIEPGITVFVVC